MKEQDQAPPDGAVACAAFTVSSDQCPSPMGGPGKLSFLPFRTSRQRGARKGPRQPEGAVSTAHSPQPEKPHGPVGAGLIYQKLAKGPSPTRFSQHTAEGPAERVLLLKTWHLSGNN